MEQGAETVLPWQLGSAPAVLGHPGSVLAPPLSLGSTSLRPYLRAWQARAGLPGP